MTNKLKVVEVNVDGWRVNSELDGLMTSSVFFRGRKAKTENSRMSFSLKNTLGELLEVRKKKHDYEALHIPAASSLNIIHLILPPLSGRRLAVPAVDKDSLLSRNLHSVLPRITLEHYSLPSIFT